MKIDKIEIQTLNKKHATDIAILVDKLEFLQEIERLREKWQIRQLYKLRTSPFKEVLNIDNVINKDITDFDEGQKRRDEFYKDIDTILKKFNRGKNFIRVVEYAFGTGVVPDGVYSGCYFDVVKIGEPDNLNNPERYQYVIVLSPRTELSEVEQTYKEFKKHIKGKIDFHLRNHDIENPTDKDLIEQYHRGNIYNSADIDKFGTLKKIDRTREWYWMRYGEHFNNASKEPKTYAKLAEEWNNRCSLYGVTADNQHIKDCPYCAVLDESYIEHALASYNMLLKLS